MWRRTKRRPPEPTGRERTFPDDEIIVTKTDPRGVITYANRLFCEVSRFAPREAVGRPHRIVRHPLMPSCVFRRMWSLLKAGEEVFLGAVNLAADGAHYWVFAHVTPTVGPDGTILGFHSTRRALPARAKERLERLYAELRDIERRHADPRAGMDAAEARLREVLAPFGDDLSRFSLELVR
ncbi:Aerotaxis receptor [bacterium HR39]|nr:Aerotaxis receptor [bacterium HR39]